MKKIKLLLIFVGLTQSLVAAPYLNLGNANHFAPGTDEFAHNNVAIGIGNKIWNGIDNLAIGRANEISSDRAGVAIGRNNINKGFVSTTLGYFNEANIDFSAAIGQYAKATRDKQVFGYDPLTETEITMKGIADYTGHDEATLKRALDVYNRELAASPKQFIAGRVRPYFSSLYTRMGGWQSGMAAIAIGNEEIGLARQITGVAAGTKDTDAVNVAQLKRTAQILNKKLYLTLEGFDDTKVNEEGKNKLIKALNKGTNFTTPTGALVTDNDVKSYVDSNNTILKNYVNEKETGLKTYIDNKETGLKTYINNKEAGLKTYIDNNDSEIRKLIKANSSQQGKDILSNSGGVAIAAAMANIPQVSADKYFSIGLGGAYFKKTGGFAIGISGQDKGKNIVYKASAGISTTKDFIVGAGINYSFGQIDNKIEVNVNNNVNNVEVVYGKDKLQKTQEELENTKQQLANQQQIINNMQQVLNNLLAQQSQMYSVTKDSQIIIDEFRNDSPTLLAKQKKVLDNVIAELNNLENGAIVDIIGYTDLNGTDKYNLQLGIKRAENVYNYIVNNLKNKQVKMRRVTSQGYNEITSSKFNAKNRRVEINIYK